MFHGQPVGNLLPSARILPIPHVSLRVLDLLDLYPLRPSPPSSAVMPFKRLPNLPPSFSSFLHVHASMAGVVIDITAPVPAGLLDAAGQPLTQSLTQSGPRNACQMSGLREID